MNTLKQVKIGSTVRVVKLHGEGAVKRRIMDMGITKAIHSKKQWEDLSSFFPPYRLGITN